MCIVEAYTLPEVGTPERGRTTLARAAAPAGGRGISSSGGGADLPAVTAQAMPGGACSLGDPGWEAQLARLAAYKAKHGDCRVPQGWAEDPGLSNWVNNQRQCKGKLDRGEPGRGMTAERRAARLTALGFWSWRG